MTFQHHIEIPTNPAEQRFSMKFCWVGSLVGRHQSISVVQLNIDYFMGTESFWKRERKKLPHHFVKADVISRHAEEKEEQLSISSRGSTVVSFLFDRYTSSTAEDHSTVLQKLQT